MKKHQIFLLLLIPLLSLALLTFSCDTTEPPGDTKPGRRDYAWSVDTVRIFSNNILSIWGCSTEDIWGVGPGGALNTNIWHYNGELWNTDGVVRNISPECVYGFTSNDVWIAGLDGKIWHYDGKSWTQNYQHSINKFTGLSFYDLYGNNINDFYAVGTVWFDNETRRGIILHYNGSNWKQEYLANYNSYFAKIRIDQNGRCFVHCLKQDIKFSTNDTTVFYEFDGKKLMKIYSDENNPIKGGWITVINGDIVFSLSNGIYKYINNTLSPIITFDNPRFPGAIFGKNDMDIFIGTAEGITHCNGTDIQLLVNTEGWIIDGKIFEKDVVFLDSEFGRGDFIYHGKLK